MTYSIHVCHHINNHNINLSKIAQTGLCLVLFLYQEICSEYIENNNQVVLGDISDSIAALVQKGKYVANNTKDTTAMGYYVLNFLSKAYTPQEDTKCYGQISTSVEIIVKA